MAKMYKKSDLKFENGYVLTQDDEVVALPPKVAEQFNDMETLLQQQAYLAAQGEAKPEPTLDGFKRESTVKHAFVTVETKHLDAEVERCEGLLHDIRQSDMAKYVNAVLAKYDELMIFMHEEKFVEGDKVVQIDTPTIGDPLTADPDEVVDRLAKGQGLE